MAPAEPRRTRLDRAARREQIVEAAARVLHGRDPSEVTFEEIADAAGVSRALVYNYFGDRHGLVTAVYAHNAEQLRRAVVQPLDGTETVREALAKFVRAYLEYARRHDLSAGETMGAALRLARAGGGARAGDVATPGLDVVVERLGGGPDARVVGRACLALVEAAALAWLEHGERDLDRATELTVTLLWSGLSGLEELGWPLPDRWAPAGEPATTAR